MSLRAWSELVVLPERAGGDCRLVGCASLDTDDANLIAAQCIRPAGHGKKARSEAKHVRIYDGTRVHGREPYTMECARCGVTAVPRPMPMPLDELVRHMNAFRDLHLVCTETP